jgi:NADH-quinone oxidoreductase subunit H
LAVILFLGGWNGPVPITEFLQMKDAGGLWGYVGNFIGMLNFLLKCVVGVTLMMWVRWTLPRLRIDQVMKTCLKYCMPLACMMFLGAALWIAGIPYVWAGVSGRTLFGLLPRQHPIGAVETEPAVAARPILSELRK